MNKIIAVILLASSALATAAERRFPECTVAISITDSEVRSGERPHFLVKVRALSSSLRVLKFAERHDLRDAYTRINIKRDGRAADTLAMISDPGPIHQSDYLELKRGQEFVFAHDGSPLSLATLAPGTYTAEVTLWPYVGSEAVSSNVITFHVRP